MAETKPTDVTKNETMVTVVKTVDGKTVRTLVPLKELQGVKVAGNQPVVLQLPTKSNSLLRDRNIRALVIKIVSSFCFPKFVLLCVSYRVNLVLKA